MEKVAEKNIIHSASLELTYACNIKCNICYQCSPVDQELTTTEIKRIIDQLAEASCLYLSFTGGEPLLRKDFWEIASHAKAKAFALILQTNGTLIDAASADRIKELNFLQVHISIFGAKDSTHDAITGVKGSFQKAVNAIRLLSKRGVTVTLKTTLMKENFAEYKAIWKLAEDLKANPYFSPIIFPRNDGDTIPTEHRLSDENMRELFSYVFAKDPKQTEIFEPKEISTLCKMGRTGCSINPKGEVYPCVAVPIVVGNLKEKSFHEIWTSTPTLDKIRAITLADLEGCADCNHISKCMLCPGLSLLEENDILASPTECCRITKITKEVIDSEKKEAIF